MAPVIVPELEGVQEKYPRKKEKNRT